MLRITGFTSGRARQNVERPGFIAIIHYSGGSDIKEVEKLERLARQEPGRSWANRVKVARGSTSTQDGIILVYGLENLDADWGEDSLRLFRRLDVAFGWEDGLSRARARENGLDALEFENDKSLLNYLYERYGWEPSDFRTPVG